MMRWIKTGRAVNEKCETTTYYESQDGCFRIESQKRAILHANGVGSWMHTTYFLIRPEGMEKESFSLKDAKEAAEK